ncbi:NADP-dependent oxidoreductase [Catenuloplanes atrovinosus]|uniref:NADPH:quinone reductase-like Zn-dependent oxidoreductase n=1 Tax=Catenuloplanes atrovinosus TaxID=137266 RepID=A0AAE3YVZ8_9ACTN|nr:NADP-dependent oxidoreductase [Catenuloplanes atrovinosus]MDR7280252.1 NADPH:quinone reductase-like Zn-dependent oxidoreductase [Catenuloplanes atrovinosus]
MTVLACVMSPHDVTFVEVRLKRVQYHQYGGPEVLRLEDFTPARPGPGEVLVRVRAAAANPMDWKIRSGALRSMTGREFPRGIGHDFAGVVEAVGAGVTRLRVGDEVLGGAPLRAAGAFAELVLAEEKAVAGKPAGLSFEDAAALPTPAVTAFQALIGKGRIRAGHAVFVHGCLGGVGRSACQIALARGAVVGGSCRTGTAPEARALGVGPIVDFDFDPAPLKGRFDLILDTAGTLPGGAARTMLKPGGRVIDIVPTPAKFLRSYLPGGFQVMIAQAVPEDLEAVARAAETGALRLPIARTVPLADAVPALTDLERGRIPARGKLVITV